VEHREVSEKWRDFPVSLVVLLSIIKQKQNIRRKGACRDFMMRERGPRRRSMRTTTGGAAALLTGQQGAVADGGGSSMEQ
jgi:hypothetical protein